MWLAGWCDSSPVESCSKDKKWVGASADKAEKRGLDFLFQITTCPLRKEEIGISLTSRLFEIFDFCAFLFIIFTFRSQPPIMPEISDHIYQNFIGGNKDKRWEDADKPCSISEYSWRGLNQDLRPIFDISLLRYTFPQYLDRIEMW